MNGSNPLFLYAPEATAVPRSAPLLPRWLRDEWLFWAAFASWSVLPSVLTPIWSISGIPVKSVDAILVGLCLLYLLPRLIAVRTGWAKNWHLGLPLWLLAMTAFGALSTTWSGLPDHDATAMRLTMALTAGSGLLGYYVVTSVSDVRAFLSRLAFALSAVSLLYTAQSMLGLGLRTSPPVNLNDFGMERVRGPLFESSTGYFLLIPGLAFVLQETLARRIRPGYGFAAIFSLSIGILGLGSRAGYALLALFIAACVPIAKGGRKAVALVIIVVVIGVGGVIIFSQAKTDRLHTRERDGRTFMHEAVANIVSVRTIPELLIGSGLGSWWPWYVTEAEGGDLYLTGRYFRYTHFGILLYHPHSTVLALGVEMGLVGISFLVALAAAVLVALRRSLRSRADSIFALGVAVSTLSLGFDLFLLRRPTRDAVWWVFLFGLLALIAQDRKRRAAA